MMAIQTQGKVTRLNTIIHVVREWQRGALPWGQVAFTADLTTEQMATLNHRVHRTTTEAELATIVAEMLSL